MRNDILKWLKNPSVNPKATFVIAVVWVALLIAVHQLLPMRKIEAHVVAPVLFKAREMLHKSPELHSSIKVFGLDDVSVSMIKKPELSPLQWVTILEALDSKHPRAIVIDALFSVNDLSSEAGGSEILARLAAIKTPIYTGAYAAPQAIYGRYELPLDRDAYQLSHYLDTAEPLAGKAEDRIKQIKIADYSSYIVYGPNAYFAKAFQRTGHILYGDDEGSFMPFLRLKDGKTLPHVMVMPFEDTTFRGDQLRINGSSIHTANDGSLPINFGARSSYDKAVTPFIHVLDERYRAKALEKVDAGDFVYLMPMFFTGNTDFKPSPIGLIPGAYSHLAVLNGFLQRSNLHYFEIDNILVVAAASLIAYLGWWMAPSALIFTLLASSLSWIFICLGAFIWDGSILPFILPQLSLLGVGIGLLTQRIQMADRKARMIRQALEGVVRPDSLKALQRFPERLSLDARERVITIVFIDIVGFSLMVENQLPRVAFSGLQKLIESMSETIHKHGGIVNKTLGDGLLCFFGYSLENNKEMNHHADEAFAAAVEIQRSNIPRILASVEKQDPVFPLRIGINTAAVFMGNLGSGERLDITVIGHGVNFAKRLESACLPHSVLIGPTTHELIQNKAVLNPFEKRMISIKHREELVESWEFDPISAQPELRSRADAIYEASTVVHRLEQRWNIDGAGKVKVSTTHGPSELVNYSAQGLSFILPKLIPRGNLLEISLDTFDGTLHRQLVKQGLQKIRVEIRWVKAENKSYIHGVRFLDLDAGQSELLMDLLCQYGPKSEYLSTEAS